MLDGLHDPANDAVWLEFDDRYRPILIGVARRLGLGEADAADVAQETLVRFVAAYRQGKYDRDRGRLGAWLTGIARHCAAELRDRRAARREQRGLSAIDHLPDEPATMAAWDAACQAEVLRRAMERLRAESRAEDRTIRAFERVAFEHESPAEVAHAMGMTANDVYLAKHRCLKRLREIVASLSVSYELT